MHLTVHTLPKDFAKSTVILIGLLVVSITGAGCGQTTAQTVSTPTSNPAEETVIGLSLSTLNNPFFVSLKEGAESAAERLDAKLIVKDAQDDAAKQKEQVETLIDQNVSVLLINPVTSESVVSVIEAANAAGIPTFTVDRGTTGGEIVSHIASDNLAGGKMAGDYLAESLDKKGNVIELEGIAGTSAAQDRGKGFNEAIAAYPDINLVMRQTANFNRAEGKAVFAQILAEQAEIDGVFAHNDEMILGAIEAAKEANRAQDILFVGFDAIDEAVNALENGDLTATIAQQPAEIGRLGVEIAVKHLEGEAMPEFIPVELALVTR